MEKPNSLCISGCKGRRGRASYSARSQTARCRAHLEQEPSLVSSEGLKKILPAAGAWLTISQPVNFKPQRPTSSQVSQITGSGAWTVSQIEALEHMGELGSQYLVIRQ